MRTVYALGYRAFVLLLLLDVGVDKTRWQRVLESYRVKLLVVPLRMGQQSALLRTRGVFTVTGYEASSLMAVTKILLIQS
jgi:hypothetical protein